MIPPDLDVPNSVSDLNGTPIFVWGVVVWVRLGVPGDFWA